MRTLFLVFNLFFILPKTWGADLILSLGEEKRLPSKNSSIVWIQDRELIQAEAAGTSVILRGRKEGATTLRIGSDLYKVQIIHPEKSATLKTLSDILNKTVGLHAEISDGHLNVVGHLYRLQDWKMLGRLIQKTSIQFRMKANISEELQQESQSYFNELFEQAKIPEQTIIFSPEAEIRVSASDLFINKYKQILRPFGIVVIKDEQSIEIAPTIKVAITVAEISRELTYKYGISWPADYKATVIGNNAIANKLELDLQALENRGAGRILASPNIICRSGKEAEFLAGGEFPIKIISLKIQDVIWKKYGILLKVKPKADASGRISISLETEVSRLDDSRKVDDLPAILTNRVSSYFDLSGPKTIALSGLLKNEDAKQSQGLPFLSNIPILGSLFSSKNFKENRTELVIFVRPSILSEKEQDGQISHIGNIE